jgi:hypothetical protein
MYTVLVNKFLPALEYKAVLLYLGHAVAQWLRYCAFNPEGQFPIVSLEFFIEIIIPVALSLWG